MSGDSDRHGGRENASQRDSETLQETSMKIQQISKFYYPYVGGLEQVVQTLAEGFHGNGHAVRVLASAENGRGARERVNGVPVIRATTVATLQSVPICPTLPAHLRKVSRDADLLHFHLPNPAAVASHFLAGSDRPPIIVTYHSDIVKQAAALEAYRPILRRFLDRADRIIVTSPNLLDHSAHLEPFADKCEVVPLSIDLDEFSEYDGPTYDLPGDSSRPTLLFVGRLSYYKGVEYLIDAMADVDADLLVVGGGERRETLERRARNRGVDGDVSFLGKVPGEMLRYCYEAADVFVLPSIAPSEAFGVVQLEAMATGTPVVNTDLPTGVPWVSRDGETGLTVPPKDAAALTGAINDLLGDAEQRRTYGANARERVERRFTTERMLEGTEAVYRDAMN
ncbi:glycosyltransferase [Halegenticoccus tardaugens]|uniref:glycosyltransferase n=1 Tax=Halegenticoccus tardaugens TaxID=2071624 RepID=UPI001E5D897F|nr:glycosyltransferase [Halegenticoccus tardaugens]